jgi:Protein of unknown function (DUF3237)
MLDKTSSPQLEFALELRVNIGPTFEIGSGAPGIRRTVPIIGGTFRGPLLSGRVLSGGADWQLVESNGLTFVDARYVIETDDAVRIEVRNQGIRHGPREVIDRIAAGDAVSPSEYYFRTTPRFHPPDGQYDWLRRSVFIGLGERYADLVLVKVWRVV